MSELVCIINPRSCAGRTADTWPAIARAFDRAGLHATAVHTAQPGDATRLAREALRGGARTVVAVGGDGTIHEVVNGFFDQGRPIAPYARLGIMPSGTGCDLVRTLGIPCEPGRAIERLVKGAAVPIDVGLARYKSHSGHEASEVFINTASAGLSGLVLSRMGELPPFLNGTSAYLVASLLSLGQFQPFACDLVLDGEEVHEPRCLLAAVGNGRYFGGGMQILPRAKVDDGLLDVLIIRDRPLPELLFNLPRLYLGTHLTSPIVRWTRARRIRIAPSPAQLIELDGEQPGTSAIEIEVLPGAVNVII